MITKKLLQLADTTFLNNHLLRVETFHLFIFYSRWLLAFSPWLGLSTKEANFLSQLLTSVFAPYNHPLVCFYTIVYVSLYFKSRYNKFGYSDISCSIRCNFFYCEIISPFMLIFLLSPHLKRQDKTSFLKLAHLLF